MLKIFSKSEFSRQFIFSKNWLEAKFSMPASEVFLYFYRRLFNELKVTTVNGMKSFHYNLSWPICCFYLLPSAIAAI